MRSYAVLTAVSTILLAAAPIRARAQQNLAVGPQKPRFIATWAPPGQIVDASAAAVLWRRVAVDLKDAPVDVALDQVAARAHLELSYNKALVVGRRPVTLRAEEITVAAALTAVLLDAGLDVGVGRSGQLTLIKATYLDARITARDSGVVTGRVTDSGTGAALAGATVALDGTRHTATAGGDGRYRIAQVATGTYTVRARYIGYAPSSASVVVSEAQEATVDFGLVKSVQRLDEVVTTGTVIPTEIKALSTPISVITAEDLERQHIRRIEEAIRLVVPGAVAWDQGNSFSPGMQVSVRGTSGLDAASNPKVYIDGVEASVHNLSPVDPQSIERIEVVRGPQAAAIYGSDAMGGVIQIFTKRGNATRQRPEIEAGAALGRIESDFQGSGALRQEYSGAVHGQSGPASYRVGGGYTHTGDWLPYYRNSTPSAYGGLRVDQGPLAVDLSGRYYQQDIEVTDDPRVQAAWPAVFPNAPYYQPTQNQEETFAARLEYRPVGWWQHSLTAGIDRFSFSEVQTRPRLTTPADTFLLVNVQHARKASFAYHTALTGTLLPGVTANLTTGADHWIFTYDLVGSGQALTTTGPIQVVPGTVSLQRNRTTNTGAFAQAQLNVSQRLFVTGAVRGEWNSDFGDELGVPVSPRVGLTSVSEMGSTTLKLRAAYGEAIRPPEPGSKDGSITPFAIFQPNPSLKPERQIGPDFGLDLVFGRRGSLSVTYYHQIAKDLLQSVLRNANSVRLVRQWQNVARVRNVGWEFEGTLQVGWVALTGQYAVTDSKAENLGPSYTGDVQVGEQILDVPHHTGAATVTMTPLRRISVAAAVAYTGSRKSYDFLALYRCFGGTGPCNGFTPSGYLIDYPGFATLNLSIEQQVTPMLRAYLGVEDLTDISSKSRSQSNGFAIPGRITTIGVRIRR